MSYSVQDQDRDQKDCDEKTNEGADSSTESQIQPEGSGVGNFFDFLQQNWYVSFVVFGLISILSNSRKSNSRSVTSQILILLAFTLVTVKFERFLSKKIINPLLEFVFGFEKLKKRNEELERMERLLKEKLKDLNG
mmetsp:Transcript_6497/g.7906  ORF Transcript_6497/g.7906 Transcript_6497/m.7906 type:complete len:136 (-) Transcript_6497:74-481(-)